MADTKPTELMTSVLQDLLIIQLALSGVNNHSIRKIAGVQMGKVTRISKILKKGRKRRGADNG